MTHPDDVFDTREPDEIEEARLAALAAVALDTSPESAFDGIANAAARLMECPIALVSIMEADRQWFKANCGFSTDGTSRDVSFCKYAVDGRTVIEALDATRDPRFQDNPLVTGRENIRYYLGVPVRSSNGHVLGTLCVLDRKARRPASPETLDILRGLANAVEMILSSRTVMAQQKARLETLAALEAELDEPSDELEVVSQLEPESADSKPRDWAKKLADEFAREPSGAEDSSGDHAPQESNADEPATPKAKRNQWGVLVTSAVRAMRPMMSSGVSFETNVEDGLQMEPPIIFGRVLFAALRDAVRLSVEGATIEVTVERRSGFILTSITFPGRISEPNTDVARWMRTVGGLFNVKNEGDTAQMLAWVPIV
jgi:hypothetical protein